MPFVPSPPVHSVRRTLAAGPSGVTVVEVPGRKFRIKEAAGPVEVKLDDGGSFPFELGMWYECPRETGFNRIEILNRSAEENRIEVVISDGSVGDDRLNVIDGRVPLSVMDQASDARSLFAGNLAPGEFVLVPDAPGVGYRRRSALLVTNGSREVRLTVTDVSGAVLGYVFPEQVQAFPISGPVKVLNGTGAPVETVVSEILARR